MEKQIKAPDVSYYYFDAILELVPGIRFSARVCEEGILQYEDIKVDEGTGTLPSKEEIEIKAEELRLRAIANSYVGLRRNEYPPASMYLDAVVKGDQEQIQAYIDACLAVKAKYPKPE